MIKLIAIDTDGTLLNPKVSKGQGLKELASGWKSRQKKSRLSATRETT